VRAHGSVGLLAVGLCLAGCTPLAVDAGRAGKSSLGCMRASLANHDLASRPDYEAHCIAAGVIARRCSVAEAWLASYGKEIRDLLGRGDAEWRDVQSDQRGIECARTATGDAALLQCCASPPASP
jgi:hypothetical protein